MQSTAPTRNDDATQVKAITTVTFVIPARNEQRHLKQCLDSIRSQSANKRDDIECALIVVDNQSTDATPQIARQCGATVIEVEPGKPGRARNVGAEATDADLIAFVDADCVLPRGWLDQTLHHFADPEVVAVGAVQDRSPADTTWVERAWLSLCVPASTVAWQPVEWLPAFNCMVRREAFTAVNGFDETLQTCEDSDLSYRLGQRGQLRRDYRQPVHHLGESKSLAELFRRELWRSQGNFRSALNRGAVRSELVSLLLPAIYVLAWATLVLTLPAAILLGGPASIAALTLTIAVVSIPLSIAAIKGELKHLPSCAVVTAAYLLARGVGPLLRARRVER